ncbi:MAG: hypothetical protein JZU52_09030 [Lamprocystis purpurea]|jgi:hypothetical protein|uniref:hypothetical protein n=1 Tax=Lamprocystis purpurea TaxID=61598 RepID=UPI000475D2AB|nr:hypothetical protein [Lamprocystis purpurea]MBV5273769.1 hypothetical protein [Lamprocystis purpurea]
MNSNTTRAAASAIALGALGTMAITPATADQTWGAFSAGADMRLREEYIENIGLNDQLLTPTGNVTGNQNPTANRVFQRYRFRAWGQYAPSEHFALAARLMWEGRHYTLPPESAFAPGYGFEKWYSGGILFDSLTLDFKKIFDSGLSLKAGRQDLVLGNGWLVLDGTPIDGSRTIYMDAARATYAADAIKTTFDLIYINNYPNTDRFPTPLNGTIEDQTEQYEEGGILYARNKSLIKDTDLDGYFIYKGNDPNYTLNNMRVNNGYPFPSPSDDGQVYAVGARIDSKLTPNWNLRAEAAGEWGANRVTIGAPRQNISAFGFNGRLTYAFNDSLANRVHADLEYLTGDDPDSKTNESFDPLWGRWPQWSELMIYQWPLDSRVGQATNLIRLNVGWLAKVHPTTEVLLDYHALWADQESVRTANQFYNISHDGNFRGHLFTGWVKTKFNKYLSGHLVAEYLAPGDFYARNRRDESYFLRAEVVVAF